MRRWIGILTAAVLFSNAPAAWAVSYEIDPAHSSVEFRIRHLLSHVKGSFNEFAGSFDYEPGKPETWKAEAVIQTASIDTRVEKRDAHLRSKDFFEAETYPTVTFRGAKITHVMEKGAHLEGLLTLHGVTKPVVLDVEIHGIARDMQGKSRAGFTATTTLDRKDFGITWNKLGEAGQLLGDSVQIAIEIEGVEKQP